MDVIVEAVLGAVSKCVNVENVGSGTGAGIPIGLDGSGCIEFPSSFSVRIGGSAELYTLLRDTGQCVVCTV